MSKGNYANRAHQTKNRKINILCERCFFLYSDFLTTSIHDDWYHNDGLISLILKLTFVSTKQVNRVPLCLINDSLLSREFTLRRASDPPENHSVDELIAGPKARPSALSSRQILSNGSLSDHTMHFYDFYPLHRKLLTSISKYREDWFSSGTLRLVHDAEKQWFVLDRASWALQHTSLGSFSRFFSMLHLSPEHDITENQELLNVRFVQWLDLSFIVREALRLPAYLCLNLIRNHETESPRRPCFPKTRPTSCTMSCR